MFDPNQPLPHRFGEWELVALLGRGGMASVYRARRAAAPESEAEVALKIVDPARAAAEPHLARAVLREGELVAQLQHRNMVRVHRAGEIGGVPYLVMELVRGLSVAQLLRLRGAPLSPSMVLDLGLQLCQALEYAHDLPDADDGAHLVHRDVKPANVLIGVDGTVKLADFGIARATRPDDDLATRTLTGQVKGTTAYMAPEQLGRNPHLDGRADLFSLGSLLFEAALGERLFNSDEPAEIIAMLWGDVEAAVAGRGVPDRLDVVVPGLGGVARALLSKRPEDRPANAGEAYSRLAGLLGGIPREPHALRKAVRAAARSDERLAWALTDGSSGAPTPAWRSQTAPAVSDAETRFDPAPPAAPPPPHVARPASNRSLAVPLAVGAALLFGLLAIAVIGAWILTTRSDDEVPRAEQTAPASAGADLTPESMTPEPTPSLPEEPTQSPGTVRRLTEEEKTALLAGRDRDGAAERPAPAETRDSPFATPAVLDGFEDGALRDKYLTAVDYVSRGNSRSARPLLVELDEQATGKPWEEPVAALLVSANASMGDSAEVRTAATEFKIRFPGSPWLATVVVAEGRAEMVAADRARPSGSGTDDPISDEQAALYREAIEKWDLAIRTWPADPAVADAYADKSDVRLALGDLAGAESAADALATSFPSSRRAPRALINVARAYADADQTEPARRVYQRIVDDFGSDRLARTARSQVTLLQMLGRPAPELQIDEWIGNEPPRIADHRGKVVLLVFWATWCPHCRRAMPDVEETWRKYEDDGLVVIAITRNSKGQTTPKVREYAAEHGFTMPIGVDPGTTSRAYAVTGIPAAAIIDKHGDLVFRNHPSRVDDALLNRYL